jgi:hypothetical protein
MLRGAPIGDDALRHLEGLPLQRIDLSATMVTDAALEHLARLPDLDFVTLCDTSVTAAAVARWKPAHHASVQIDCSNTLR